MSRKIIYVQYTNPAAYPPLEHSSRILAELGWKVLMFGTTALGASALEMVPHENIEVRRWRFVPPGLGQKVHFLAYNLRAISMAILSKPKWVYASDLLACPAALVLKKLGFRVLYHEHDSPDDPFPLPASSAFQRFLLWTRAKVAQGADLCVLPSEMRIERFNRLTGRRKPALCVWNCPARCEAEITPEKREGAFVIFYHGSIVPSRMPTSVIDSLLSLPSSVRLEFAGYETVGHPGYASQLLDHARQIGVVDRVEYLGVFSRSKLLPRCRQAHIGLSLLPMKTRDPNQQTMVGASNKPFDYMACGLALLVNDLRDWAEMFVDPGFGRVCNPSDPESIAAAVRWFIDHQIETESMGDRGRRRILDDWNYEIKFASVLQFLAD